MAVHTLEPRTHLPSRKSIGYLVYMLDMLKSFFFRDRDSLFAHGAALIWKAAS